MAPSTIHVRPNSIRQKKSVQRRSSFMSSGPVGARAYGVVNSGSASADEDDGFTGVDRMLDAMGLKFVPGMYVCAAEPHGFSPIVGVNVNTTDATTGVTALLLPALGVWRNSCLVMK